MCYFSFLSLSPFSRFLPASRMCYSCTRSPANSPLEPMMTLLRNFFSTNGSLAGYG